MLVGPQAACLRHSDVFVRMMRGASGVPGLGCHSIRELSSGRRTSTSEGMSSSSSATMFPRPRPPENSIPSVADQAVPASNAALAQDQIAVFKALGGGWRTGL